MSKTKVKEGATTMDESLKTEPTPPKTLDAYQLVKQKFEERVSYKLKIAHLWTSKNDTAYFRVNYLHEEDHLKLESYWVTVYNGEVNAEKEKPPKKF